MPRYFRFLMPLVIFLALVGLLYKGLSLDPRLVPSPLVDKPAPAFTLPRLNDAQNMLSDTDFKGKVSLFNVWATWCVGCRAEHPVLMQLAELGVPIYGMDYKDNREAAQRWLKSYGDPYIANAFDEDGRTGINWGVYGTPETFVIDKQGIIRHKHVGPLTSEIIKRDILPLVTQLQGGEG